MSFDVDWSVEAIEDLERLADHILDRALYAEDLDMAQRALDAIRAAADSLSRNPLLYRRARPSARKAGALRRQLVIAFGSQGYVLEYEVATPSQVIVLAVRHQREQDRL